MGKWSQEARDAHKQRMREIWASKRRGGGTTAVTKAAPKGALPTVVRPVRRAPIEGTVVTDLDEAILARQREIEVLQQAKEILERC